MPIPEVRPLNRRSARQTVYEQVLEWITDGTLAPGEVIRDHEIAERLGVSRTPVREALQMLEQLGTVETFPGQSTRVAPALASDGPAVYQPLTVLHALAVELATPNVTEADFEELQAANQRLRAAIDAEDALAARKADEEFHLIIVGRTGNRFVQEVIGWLTAHSRRLESLYFSHRTPARESCDEHAEIIAAMRSQDGRAAAAVVERQWQRAAAVLADLAADEAQPGTA